MRRQSGAVLVVGMMFLIVLTLLATSLVQSTTSQERMSGNSREMNLAHQAAEAALRDAFYDVTGQCQPGATCAMRNPAISGATGFGDASANVGSCSSTGLCRPAGTFPNYTNINISNWSGSGAGAVSPVRYGTYTLNGGATNLPFTSRPPEYIIEAMCMVDANVSSSSGSGCPRYYYRVTARGWGMGKAVVTLQAVIKMAT